MLLPNISLIMSDLESSLRGLKRVIINGGRRGPLLKSRVSVSKIRGLLRQRGLALDEFGRSTWFYRALHRKDSDPLTNYTLDFICKEVPKNSELLITGCGTGLMLFYLMDQGFKHVEGFDFLEKCVLVANDIVKLGKYGTRIWHDDGFNPVLEKKYDLITAMHWVFSAWMGNYGNQLIPPEKAKSPEVRERLLFDFISKYPAHLNPGGLFIVELTDAVADYRVPLDSSSKVDALLDDYLIRHTPDQVSRCAQQCGLKVVSYKMCCSYGYQPRTSYMLRKD